MLRHFFGLDISLEYTGFGLDLKGGFLDLERQRYKCYITISISVIPILTFQGSQSAPGLFYTVFFSQIVSFPRNHFFLQLTIFLFFPILREFEIRAGLLAV